MTTRDPKAAVMHYGTRTLMSAKVQWTVRSETVTAEEFAVTLKRRKGRDAAIGWLKDELAAGAGPAERLYGTALVLLEATKGKGKKKVRHDA